MTIKCHFDGRVLVPDEPVDLPVGVSMSVEVRATGVAIDEPPEGPIRLGELRDSGILGGWEHRDDIGNSVEFARRLRADAERRGGRP
jgi:hypothetical protein